MQARPSERLFMIVIGLIAAGLILVPMFNLLLGSLTVQEGREIISRFSFQNYVEVFTNPRLVTALRNTLITSAGATLGAVVLGVSLAWATARTDMPGTRAFESLNLIPFFMSPFVGAFAWRMLAAPNVGVLNRVGDALPIPLPELNIYSLGGIIWVLILFYTPYVYLFTIGSFRGMDPSLEDAARMCGSSIWQTARRITLPIIAPAIMSGMLITFVTSAGIFDVPIALGAIPGIDTMSTEIFRVLQFPADFGLAATISSALFVLTLTAVMLQRRIIASRSYATVTGRGYRPRKIALGRWRYALFGLNVLYISAAAVLPIAILAVVSIQRVWTANFVPELLTLDTYRYVLFDYPLTRRALTNSIVLSLVGATVAVAAVVFLSYSIYRTRMRGRGALDAVITFPITVPGIVLAMGILVTYIRTPLYATLGIVGLAYVTRFLPFAHRTVSSVLLSIDPELDECSRVSGARLWETIRRIMLPLLRPGVAAAWLMLFVIFIRELGSSILLYSSGTEVMSVAILLLTRFGDIEQAAALSIIQTLFLLGAVVLYGRFVGLERIGM